MKRRVLPVVLAVFGALQLLHTECWLTCTDARPEIRPAACHKSGGEARSLSDSHNCANHAPQVALITTRTSPNVHDVVLTTLTPSSVDPSGTWVRDAVDVVATDCAAPPGVPIPLRI